MKRNNSLCGIDYSKETSRKGRQRPATTRAHVRGVVRAKWSPGGSRRGSQSARRRRPCRRVEPATRLPSNYDVRRTQGAEVSLEPAGTRAELAETFHQAQHSIRPRRVLVGRRDPQEALRARPEGQRGPESRESRRRLAGLARRCPPRPWACS